MNKDKLKPGFVVYEEIGSVSCINHGDGVQYYERNTHRELTLEEVKVIIEDEDDL